MSKFLLAAVQAAKIAGAIQKRFYGKPLTIELKGGNPLNLVTHVDKQCEKAVFKHLKKRFPSHVLWGEESGRPSRKNRWTWVVDPLDGTTNYAHGYPFFCCSVALLDGERPVAGAVYEPLRGELFAAERGGGATLNGKRIRVSQVSKLEQALLCTGFAYSVKETGYNLENFKRFVLRAQGVRRDGSAALNLCQLAAGRFDGFWERGIQAWDMAAGSVIIQEAGGLVTDVTGSPFDVTAQNALASNGLLHKEMLEILRNSPDEKNFRPSPPTTASPSVPAAELPLFQKRAPVKKKRK